MRKTHVCDSDKCQEKGDKASFYAEVPLPLSYFQFIMIWSSSLPPVDCVLIICLLFRMYNSFVMYKLYTVPFRQIWWP